MKTSELTGAALDWAVAKCEPDDTLAAYFDEETGEPLCHDDWQDNQEFKPSFNWAQGGSIIEREKIALFLNGNDEWAATDGIKNSVGDTPLIAAMRCYVASKLGDEIDLPVEMHEEDCPAIDGFGCRCGEEVR
jgi:hypothetical protein